MKIKRISTLSILILFYGHLYSQIDTLPPLETEWIEKYIENMETEEIDLSEELSGFIIEEGVRLNINSLSANAAFRILKMTDFQYYQLLSYIDRHGELVSLHELVAIDGFTKEYVQQIGSYIYVESVTLRKKGIFKNLKYGKGEVLLRYGSLLETPAGYDTLRDNHYLGSKSRVSFKLKYSDNKHISIGFAGEKDPGEAVFSKNYRQGFDHYSGHLLIKDLGILKTLIAGDFRMNWGQGLILGSGLSGGSGGVNSLRRFPSDLQAVASMNEGNYFTGIATAIGTHRWQTTLFYGKQFFDASIQDDISEEDILFDGTLATNGHHRTEKELVKKRKIQNRVAGFEFRYNRRLLRIGIRSLAQFLTVHLIPPNSLYRIFDFEGNKLFNSSIDYQWVLGKSVLFGEVAMSNLSGFGILQGIIFSPDPRMKCGVLFRTYSRRFHTVSGNAFGVNGRNQHETGIYLSQEIVLGRKTELLTTLDLYQIHWLRYRIDKPEFGERFTAKISHQLVRNTNLVFSYRYRTDFRNNHNETQYNEVGKIGKHQGGISFSYSVSSKFSFKSHVEYVVNHNMQEKNKKIGYLIYQDINYSAVKLPFSIRYRIAFFDTDSYDERIYAYEHDMNQVFNISGYYYRGWRNYITLKYQYKFIKIQIKYSRTFYLNKREIGSGLELINGNQKNEIKGQVIFGIN
ncbi:hypothetical protein LJC68_05995 [Bacteroidales bacterium OttesenSCG-928-B11]|nr:hypothetical protein [Bacteroidales bacterium OttesenSCG-928-E04]MDL2312410.1 hypothetical protein [Bacteroidales bacterium OttesenSCG-928-B11]MDL2326313.1 hypothetical protein [Bacteroidales bacterium OttesenSCG-928-A14]